MIIARSYAKLIAQIMEQRTGKLVTTKDVFNLKTKFENQSHNKVPESDKLNKLQYVINEGIQIDNQDNFGEDESNSKICMIFYQNQQMCTIKIQRFYLLTGHTASIKIAIQLVYSQFVIVMGIRKLKALQ